MPQDDKTNLGQQVSTIAKTAGGPVNEVVQAIKDAATPPPLTGVDPASDRFTLSHDYWPREVPMQCDCCGTWPRRGFYFATFPQDRADFKVMCRACYILRGVPIRETGGARYRRQPDGRWFVVERYDGQDPVLP